MNNIENIVFLINDFKKFCKENSELDEFKLYEYAQETYSLILTFSRSIKVRNYCLNKLIKIVDEKVKN